jgi:hypothetical protein
MAIYFMHERNMYEILDENPQGKRPIGRLGHRTGKDNIKMYLREISLKGVNWFHLAEGKDL